MELNSSKFRQRYSVRHLTAGNRFANGKGSRALHRQLVVLKRVNDGLLNPNFVDSGPENFRSSYDGRIIFR
jgi:hypothetical protein